MHTHHLFDQKSVYMVLMPLCTASVKEMPWGYLSSSYNTQSEYLPYIRVGCYSPSQNLQPFSLNQYASYAISGCLYILIWILGRRQRVCMQCSGMQFCPPLAIISANKKTRQELSMRYRRICAYMGCKIIGSTVKQVIFN